MDEIEELLHRAVAHGVFPGAVAQVRRGRTVVRAKAGVLASRDRRGAEIVESAREEVDYDVRYDLASLTKLYSAITLLSLVDDGIFGLDEPVADHLEAFRTDPDRRRVTLRHLLTHTSGLPASWTGWARPGFRAGQDRDGVLAEIVAMPLENPPGVAHEYSCVGYIAAMALAEAATGVGWEPLVEGKVFHQLGLDHSGFNPTGARCAPTEDRTNLGRGVICGVVHDETAWALGGVSANAGVFASLADVCALAVAVSGGLVTVLSPSSSELMWRDQLPALLGARAAQETARIGYRQAICLRIGDLSAMGGSGAALRGITGFTGTSLVMDGAGGYAVLLSNRVHPTRNGPPVASTRAAFAEAAGLVPAVAA